MYLITMEQERIHWVDISKCLLIICVIVYHIPVFAEQNGVEGFEWMYNIRPFFRAYFMPAFFVITGFCSTFQGPSFWSFAYKNFKLLMIPNFLIEIGTPISSYLLTRNMNVGAYIDVFKGFAISGGFWFLTSLFFAKLAYYGMKQLSKSMIVVGVMSLVALLVGIILHESGFPNIWNLENTLALIPFFWIGQITYQYQSVMLRLKSLIVISLLYPLGIVLFHLMCDGDEPFITLHVEVALRQIPLFLMLSISGTFLCFMVSKWILRNKIMEYIGRETITIYLFHMYFLLKLLPHIKGIVHTGLTGYVGGVLVVLATLAFCSIVDKILTAKYFKWVLGKF